MYVTSFNGLEPYIWWNDHNIPNRIHTVSTDMISVIRTLLIEKPSVLFDALRVEYRIHIVFPESRNIITRLTDGYRIECYGKYAHTNIDTIHSD